MWLCRWQEYISIYNVIACRKWVFLCTQITTNGRHHVWWPWIIPWSSASTQWYLNDYEYETSGAPLHTLSKLYDPVGFVNPHPSSFEAVYCFICGRRRVAVARYRMICLFLTIRLYRLQRFLVFLSRSNIHSFFVKSSIKKNITEANNYFEILPLSSANNLYIFLVLSAKQQQCKFDIYEKRYRAILNYNKQAFIRRLVGLNRFRWLPWKLFTQGCLCIRSLEWGISSIHL